MFGTTITFRWQARYRFHAFIRDSISLNATKSFIRIGATIVVTIERTKLLKKSRVVRLSPLQ